ncbi:hypothetical protein D9M68_604320 [compost metagenome]
MLAHALVETAQEQRTAIGLGGLRAHAVEDRGELHGDVAAAHHQHPARQFFEEEGLVRGDGMFLARDVGHLGPAAGRYQDMGGAIGLAVDFDRIRVQDAGVPFQERHPAVDQQVAVDAVETLDFAVFVGDQRGPVERGLPGAPAETVRLLEILAVMGAIDQQLLGHAAHVDAGAAQVTAFRHGHARAEAGREARRAHAAGTRADHKQIKIKCHDVSFARPPGPAFTVRESCI